MAMKSMVATSTLFCPGARDTVSGILPPQKVTKLHFLHLSQRVRNKWDKSVEAHNFMPGVIMYLAQDERKGHMSTYLNHILVSILLKGREPRAKVGGKSSLGKDPELGRRHRGSILAETFCRNDFRDQS